MHFAIKATFVKPTYKNSVFRPPALKSSPSCEQCSPSYHCWCSAPVLKYVRVQSQPSSRLHSALPAPNFHKCNRKSPDFKTCLLESARKGVRELVRPYPELTIPSLEPFELTEATIGGTEGPVNIQQKFKKCKFYGLPKLQLDEFE